MKSHIVRLVCLLAVSLGLAAVASAQNHRTCSNASIAGAWGYTETGTVMVPSTTPPTPVLAVAVGRYTFDRQGNFSGTQYSSAGGAVGQDTKQGTYTLKHDCTGTLTLSVWRDGVNVRNSVWAIVLTDDATEMRAIMTSMVVPNGPTLMPIMTLSATRVITDERDHEWDRR